MSRRLIAWNVATNTAGVLISILAAFFVMPFLIQELGAATYGLWSLIGSLAGYFGLLGFGVSPAVGRLIAAYRAQGDVDRIKGIISTSLALLSAVGVGIVLTSFLGVKIFPLLFSVPVDRALDVRDSLILIGLTVAISSPASVLEGFLWGYERFDLVSAVDAGATLIRTVLILSLVRNAHPLTTLAAIVLVVNILAGIVKCSLCFRVDHRLRIGWRHFRKEMIGEIYSYGSWISLIALSKNFTPQSILAVIGHFLGTTAVTSYTVGMQLVTYSDVFVNSATQVMAPRAIAAYTMRAADSQRKLLIGGGAFALALTLYFVGGLLCLGYPFIHRWQHGSQDASYVLMVILALGQALPMSQWISYSILVGSNRHRFVGVLALGEFLAAIILTAVAAKLGGLFWLCIAAALVRFLLRGITQLVAACRVVDVGIGHYAKQVVAPVTLAAIVPITMLWVSRLVFNPSGFLGIGALGIGYSLLFLSVVGFSLLGATGIRNAIRQIFPQAERFGG
jgi:O-antigen/teichoic acid export membrane protein